LRAGGAAERVGGTQDTAPNVRLGSWGDGGRVVFNVMVLRMSNIPPCKRT